MMLKRILISILFLPLLSIYAQYGNTGLSASLRLNYTTTSRLFLNPNSADRYAANAFEELNNVTSYSLSIRYQLSELIAVGVNTELIEKTYFGKNVNASSPSGVIRVEVEEGYMIIPVEFNLIFLLPFSTETLKFDMSGGVGFYFGKHIRNFGNAEIQSSIDGIPFGIQVGVGSEYMIFNYLSVRFDMRFRDPEVKFNSRYLSRDVIYKDMNIALPIDSFTTKVNINGVTFGLGVSYHL